MPCRVVSAAANPAPAAYGDMKPGRELGKAPASAGCVGLITIPPCLRFSRNASCKDDNAARLNRKWLVACKPFNATGADARFGELNVAPQVFFVDSLLAMRDFMENSTDFLVAMTVASFMVVVNLVSKHCWAGIYSALMR